MVTRPDKGLENMLTDLHEKAEQFSNRESAMLTLLLHNYG